MPTYEYACTSCDEHLEVVQSFRDDPLTECPVCGGTLRKVFAPIGVVFKGSGFYKTDSRSASKGGGSGRADGGSKATESGSAESGSSDSGSGSSATKSEGATASGKDATPKGPTPPKPAKKDAAAS